MPFFRVLSTANYCQTKRRFTNQKDYRRQGNTTKISCYTRWKLFLPVPCFFSLLPSVFLFLLPVVFCPPLLSFFFPIIKHKPKLRNVNVAYTSYWDARKSEAGTTASHAVINTSASQTSSKAGVFQSNDGWQKSVSELPSEDIAKP